MAQSEFERAWLAQNQGYNAANQGYNQQAYGGQLMSANQYAQLGQAAAYQNLAGVSMPLCGYTDDDLLVLL